MLIIGLPHSADTESYDHVRVDEGARPLDQGAGQPGDFAAHAQRVALVPHSRLSWHRVRLPAVPRGQQRAAIEGLLEDQWLQAPSTLHISVHPLADAAPDEPNCWVGVCDAEWLRQVLQPLIQAGCMPQRLVPEFAPRDAAQPDTLHVLGPADQPAVVWSRAEGVLAAPWPPPWPLLSSTPMQMWAEPAVTELAQQALAAASPETCGTLTRAQRWAHAATQPWDLAQGEWSQTAWQRVSRRALAGWRALALHPGWKPARWALALALAGQALGLLIWAGLNEQELGAQRRDMDNLLKQTFPTIQTVVDAPMQMQQALNRLRIQVGAPGPTQPEVMIEHLTQGLPASVGLTRIRFDGQNLVVQGLRADALTGPKLQRLQDLGYSVQQTPDGLLMRWGGQP